MMHRIPTSVLWLIAAALFIVGPIVVVQIIAVALFLTWAFVEYRILALRSKGQ